MAKESTNSSVVKADPRLTSLRPVLESKAYLDQLAKVLPPNLPPQKLVRQAITLCQENPRLLDCTQQSFLAGIMKAAELNLEMNGVLGQSYLVPRFKSKAKIWQATFQVGYRGYSQLAYRSGVVRCFAPQTVYMNDPFHVQYGSDRRLDHKPAEGDRGEVRGYYAVCQFINQGSDFEWMTKADMEAHRLRYCKDNETTWVNNYQAMAEKTTMRMLAKRLPVSPQLTQAAVLDEYGERGVLPEGPVDGVEGAAANELADQLSAAEESDRAAQEEEKRERAATGS